MNAADPMTRYPLRLEGSIDQPLSRGLWLVKWLLAIPHFVILFFLWIALLASAVISLFAIPHYLIVAVFLDTGWTVWGARNGWGAVSFGGLITLMVLIAGVALLFTARYPKPIYDFVLGMNRWVFRVAAYALLMTDRYPPFRLDMGGQEPASEPVAATARSAGGSPLPS